MRRSYFILYCLSLFFLFASCSSKDDIEKIPVVKNKYDSSQPISAKEIIPTYGVIDQLFVIYGNFPGDISDLKVYFGEKRAILTATDGISLTGLIPKQPQGINQVSLVIGNDSLVPVDLKFKYRQSRSVKTISGKLGTNTWMADVNYAGAALDAVTFGEVHYVATVAGQKADNIFMIETGWGNRLFLLSQDDYKIQKLSTPTNLCSPAVNSKRDRFYVTMGKNTGDRTIYFYAKENSWNFNTTGIVVKQSDFPGSWVPSMTFAADDNLLYLLDGEGRIAEINLKEKSYKIYTSTAKKPGAINPANFGGLISGVLPTNFGDWEDSYLCYSKFHQCFFASFSRQHAIYKLVKNSDNTWTSTLYAGNNGQGINTGDRLTDAQFNKPHGMVVNADGEIFVVNRGTEPWVGNGHCISRIAGSMVDVIAGKPTSNSPLVNGDPLEATFNSPRNLAIDSDGNYIIAGGDDRTVRKLSIE